MKQPPYPLREASHGENTFTRDALSREPALQLGFGFCAASNDVAGKLNWLTAGVWILELAQACFGLSGLTVAHAKLEYWHTESELAMRGHAQHPLLRGLSPERANQFHGAAVAAMNLLDAELANDSESLHAALRPLSLALAAPFSGDAQQNQALVKMLLRQMQLRFGNKRDRYALPAHTRAQLANHQLRGSQQGTPAFLPVLQALDQKNKLANVAVLAKAGGDPGLRAWGHALRWIRLDAGYSGGFFYQPGLSAAFGAWRQARRGG